MLIGQFTYNIFKAVGRTLKKHYLYRMQKYFTLLFVISVAVMDYMAYRKLLRNGAGKKSRRLFSFSVIVANILPVIAALCMFVFTTVENCTVMMKASMVLFTLFILLTLIRLFFYPFWLFTSNKRWIACGVLLSSFTFVTYLYSVFVTRCDYERKEVEIAFSNLPSSFDGYRIAFVSDIHVGSMYNLESELSDFVNEIKKANADIILFGGDLVNLHYSELTPEVIRHLSAVKGKEKTIAVLGNHDTGTYVSNKKEEINVHDVNSLQSRIESCGWLLLRDSTLYLYKGNDSIAVTGVDYSEELLKHKHNFGNVSDFDVSQIYEGTDTSVFNITLSHLPQLWYSLCDGGYSDLTLSGHIHAMQFKVSLLGAVFSPGQFMYNEWSGLYERDKGKLYITDGIGTVAYYARIGARPEITVITLKKE